MQKRVNTRNIIGSESGILTRKKRLESQTESIATTDMADLATKADIQAMMKLIEDNNKLLIQNEQKRVSDIQDLKKDIASIKTD